LKQYNYAKALREYAKELTGIVTSTDRLTRAADYIEQIESQLESLRQKMPNGLRRDDSPAHLHTHPNEVPKV
jgi:hypothetical protein